MSDKTNCPNCGAPIDNGKSKCPYCDTPYREEDSSIVTHPGLFSHFDERLNGFSITFEPDASLLIDVLTPNEHRALHGLPPIARKNGKDLGFHAFQTADVNELIKEEKDV